MEDIDSAVMLKEKLLTAGIDEILTHGMGDFSLRRVAASCGASCAAPYKHFKNKEEFNDTIEQIKSSVQLMQYFDKPIHINFEKEINVNIVERKKDVFMEIIFANKYRIIGITDIKGEGFKTFIKLFKKYGQFRVHLEFEREVFIIDALKNINLNLI